MTAVSDILVVDASVLVAAVTASDSDGLWAVDVIDASSLAGPSIVRAEAINVLRRMEFSGLFSRSEADDAYREVLQAPVETFPFEPFAPRVWQLRHNLTCYDAWYVAVAEALNCPLATLDRRLGRAKGPTCDVLMPPDPAVR